MAKERAVRSASRSTWWRPVSDDAIAFSMISSTWSARSPDARCGRPSRSARTMSASPMPRLFGRIGVRQWHVRPVGVPVAPDLDRAAERVRVRHRERASVP